MSHQTSTNSCVYSAQGNLVCKVTPQSDPILKVEKYSCAKKEHFVDNKKPEFSPSPMNAAMDIAYSVSPWPM